MKYLYLKYALFILLENHDLLFHIFFSPYLQYDDGLHGYMNPGAAAAMYDPHAGHRPPALQGLPSHHSPHMSHATAASVGMHGYHSGGGGGGGHGTPSHVSPVANHVMGSIPEVHKRDKDAIYR